jgi:hypothetical protein
VLSEDSQVSHSINDWAKIYWSYDQDPPDTAPYAWDPQVPDSGWRDFESGTFTEVAPFHGIGVTYQQVHVHAHFFDHFDGSDTKSGGAS